MAIEEYNGLFESLRGIKSVQSRRKTFMDVSGYPHYENVVSNILAFLLDDSEEHGMQNLWMNALLAISVGPEMKKETQGITVEREVYTKKGNRIDLLISSDDYIVCIENKVFSGVENDLADYLETTQARNQDGKEIICCVLSLDYTAYENKDLFKNIIYGELFEEVRKNIGNYMETCDNTWLTYVKDFIATLEALGGRNMSNTKFREFYRNHYKDIEDLENQKNEYFEEIKKQATQVKSILQENIEDLKNELHYPYSVTVASYASKIEMRASAYIDFALDYDGKRSMAVETSVDAWGWHISLLNRGNVIIEQILADSSMRELPHTVQELRGEVPGKGKRFYGSHYIVKNLSEELSELKVAEEIVAVVKTIAPALINYNASKKEK